MTRAKWIILLAFVVIFCAGAVVGMASRGGLAGPVENPPVAPPPPPPGHGPGHARGNGNRPPFDIATALGLSPEQRQKMKEIFEPLHNRQAFDAKRHALQQEREAAVRGMLSEQQRAQYAQILKDYDDKLAALDAERDKAFKDAVQEARSIMNDEQRAKYDQMLARRADPHRRGMGGGPSTRPTGEHGDHGSR